MKLNLTRELATMERMTVGQLQDRYAEVFGEPVRSRHKQYLIRRIAWRLQANDEGGLSERALRRAEELANDADVRVTAPRWAAVANGAPIGPATVVHVAAARDVRLPGVGSQITRPYKGRPIVVTVLADGFDYLGDRYKSLTAVAKVVSGTHVNGFRFFGLEGRS